MVKEKVINQAETEGAEVQKTQSIFYKLKKDFKAYLTFRCINNRSTLERPEINHMTSDEFCAESWKEKNDKKSI
jgi:DNA polymerase III alpha subunit